MLLVLTAVMIGGAVAEICDDNICWKHGLIYFHREEMDAGY